MKRCLKFHAPEEAHAVFTDGVLLGYGGDLPEAERFDERLTTS